MKPATLIAINAEREAQDKKWGGPEHDDHHSTHDWIAYIVKHAGKSLGTDAATFRTQMIRVAALAVAAAEASDRFEKRRLAVAPLFASDRGSK